ncbi:MAG: putative phage transcriptional regulator [Clostridia bacterium]|jgi:putative transcriptional regulator|nr:putative phage transcriptional regulator [Clostridia bacterium]
MGIDIKIARIKKGIKQQDLARELGISKQYLGKLENGKATNPSRELMLKLSEVLDTDVQTLFFQNNIIERVKS